jgi:phosphomannomutase
MARVTVDSIDRMTKRDDFRGIYPTDLNEEVAYYLGRAIVQIVFADHAGSHSTPPRIIVGWDMRQSSPALSQALICGLMEERAEVCELGQCGTELVYFAVGADSANSGGVMITASHNAKDQNGFKIVKQGAEPVGADELRRIAARVKEFVQQRPHPVLDLTEAYAKTVLQTSGVRRSSSQRLRVVVEAGHGMGGLIFQAIARDLDYLDVSYAHFQPDGSLPVGVPNPLKASYMRLVQDEVARTGADLGLAFDSDADRVGVVDGKGKVMSSNELISLIAEQILRNERPDRKIMYNVVCSRLVFDNIARLDGIPWVTPVGHGQIKLRMRKPEHADCAFAGEHSGHFFFRDFFQADSAMIAALMIIEAALAAKDAGSSLQDKVADWRRKYFSSSETNFNIRRAHPDLPMAAERERMRECVQRVRQHYALTGREVEEYTPNDPFQDSHGVPLLRMEFTEEFGDWWFCLRPSGNEPLLRLVVEVILRDEHVPNIDGYSLMEERYITLIDIIGREYMEES